MIARQKLLLAALCLALPATARAVETPELSIINGLISQDYLGGGKGVTIAVLDAGMDITHPAIRGSVSLSKDFTGENITDDDKGDAGHGTGIAALLVGHDGVMYKGLAPSAKLINARVVTWDDRTGTGWAGTGLLWAAKSGAKVMNMSFGNKTNDGPLGYKFQLMTDYVAEQYGISVTVAAGNENDSAVQQNPGGAYNIFNVGAVGTSKYSRVTEFSNYALDNDARTKPDLVAPGTNINIATADWEKDTNYYFGNGTSYSAPIVGGVIAQLMGYGKSHDISTDPLLMKAIVMTSATKVKKNDGSPWDARKGGRDLDYGYRFTRPLDEEQGAGRIDALAAYKLYAKKKDATSPVNTWREGALKANQSATLALGKLTAGFRLDATLAWYRHVGRKDVNDNGLDVNDQFFQSATLADFVLTLLRDGVPIAASDSDVDNVEHLSWLLERTGNYSIEVYRFEGLGELVEDYALAARVLNTGSAGKGKSGATLAARAAAAQSASGVTKSISVPEPSSALVLLIGGMIAFARRPNRINPC